jgi:hypothetical protein
LESVRLRWRRTYPTSPIPRAAHSIENPQGKHHRMMRCS